MRCRILTSLRPVIKSLVNLMDSNVDVLFKDAAFDFQTGHRAVVKAGGQGGLGTNRVRQKWVLSSQWLLDVSYYSVKRGLMCLQTFCAANTHFSVVNCYVIKDAKILTALMNAVSYFLCFTLRLRDHI